MGRITCLVYISWLPSNNKLIILSGVCASFIIGLDNVGAIVGESVELKCKLHEQTCQDLLWSRVKEPFGSPIPLYVDGDMTAFCDGRCSVNKSTSDCVLRINSVRLSDAGTYTCAEAVPGADSQPKKTVTVTVAGILFSVDMNHSLRGSHCSLKVFESS